LRVRGANSCSSGSIAAAEFEPDDSAREGVREWDEPVRGGCGRNGEGEAEPGVSVRLLPTESNKPLTLRLLGWPGVPPPTLTSVLDRSGVPGGLDSGAPVRECMPAAAPCGVGERLAVADLVCEDEGECW
jgi:hypothetical protein